MPKETLSINLIRSHDKGTLERVLEWALSAGRLIVILTEFIALSAFVYRFSLDRQLVDLHDEIKNKQLLVSYLKNDEDKYRTLQNRLATAKTHQDNGQQSVSLFTDFIALAQGKVRFETMVMNVEDVKITTSTNSIAQLNSFAKGLRGHSRVAKVSVDKVENLVTRSSIIASITVTLRKEQ